MTKDNKRTRILVFTGTVEHNKWEPYRWQPDPFTTRMPYNNPNKASYRDNKVYAKSRT